MRVCLDVFFYNYNINICIQFREFYLQACTYVYAAYYIILVHVISFTNIIFVRMRFHNCACIHAVFVSQKKTISYDINDHFSLFNPQKGCNYTRD